MESAQTVMNLSLYPLYNERKFLSHGLKLTNDPKTISKDEIVSAIEPSIRIPPKLVVGKIRVESIKVLCTAQSPCSNNSKNEKFALQNQLLIFFL